MRSKSRFNSPPGDWATALLLWMLGAGHCCGGCGHRSVTPGEAAQEAAPGSGELLWPPAHCSSGRCTQGIERQVCKHQISYYILGGFQSNKSSCQFLMDLIIILFRFRVLAKRRKSKNYNTKDF